MGTREWHEADRPARLGGADRTVRLDHQGVLPGPAHRIHQQRVDKTTRCYYDSGNHTGQFDKLGKRGRYRRGRGREVWLVSG